MSGRQIRLVIGVLGTIVAIVGETIALQSGELASAAMLHLAIGLTYLYGGLAIWGHEPANRTGKLMTAVGLTWFIGTAIGSSIPVVSELALAFEDTFTVLLVALVLAYPTGRLESRDRPGRRRDPRRRRDGPQHPLLHEPAARQPTRARDSTAAWRWRRWPTVVILRRWVIAPARSRRDLLPVLIAGLVFMVTLLINIVRRIADVPDDVGAILIAARDLAPAAIPVALLIGFYRQSERRQRALVEALPDRMIRFTHEGRYVESSGDGRDGPASAERPRPARRFHDLLFREAGASALAATAAALDTGDLQAFDFSLDLPGGTRQFEARIAPSGADEVTAIVRDFTTQRTAEAELRRSRARILEAADAERRRLERDLHDGAQQRLVSLSLALRLLRARLGGDGGRGADPEAVAAADEAAAQVKIAIRELRELARGIHPAILTEAGLGPAITALAERSAVPASVGALPDRRLPLVVEATAYFVVSEALANVAKYAAATSASVAAACDSDTLRVEVADDGVGGADQARGTGIRGLQDRVAALGGRLTVNSPLGEGTRVTAEIPIG